MPPVADDDDPVTVAEKLPGPGLDVLDHRTGRIDEFDARGPDLLESGGGDAVALDDQQAAAGSAVVLDGPETAPLQPGQNDLVVDDFAEQ
jgi:hypothetical protein